MQRQGEKSEQIRRAFILALNSLVGVGARTSLKILAACQRLQLSEAEFLVNKGHVWETIPLSQETISSIQKFKKEHTLLDNLERVAASGFQFITFEDSAYPKLLLSTEDFPTVLFVRSRVEIGSSEWNDIFSRTISVVGTRRMTSYGKLALRQLLPPLLAAKKTIVSGFMYGVDLEAASFTVNNGGRTIAVLGFGLNTCFPRSQKKTMEAFYEAGAVFLTEFPPDMPVLPANFVMRNRIVAGLSPATLVIEAASRSGSHITAAYANDYGRLVMAVPGPITNPFSEGSKELINQGAILVNSGQDILKALHEEDDWVAATEGESTANSVEKQILQLFLNQPSLNFETLQQLSGLSSAQLHHCLFELEIQGKISKNFGNYCLLGL